jgi:hypothetical protein
MQSSAFCMSWQSMTDTLARHSSILRWTITAYDLFKNNPGLTIRLYQVQSQIPLDDSQDFISTLDDNLINMNDKSCQRLSRFWEQVGFEGS